MKPLLLLILAFTVPRPQAYPVTFGAPHKPRTLAFGFPQRPRLSQITVLVGPVKPHFFTT